MKRNTAHDLERSVFRLDFALRGHGAYTEPNDLEELIARVERANRKVGAPLLRHLDDCLKERSEQLLPGCRRRDPTGKTAGDSSTGTGSFRDGSLRFFLRFHGRLFLVDAFLGALDSTTSSTIALAGERFFVAKLF